MESNTNSLLPFILDQLSREPDLCTTVTKLTNQLQDLVDDEMFNAFGSVDAAVYFALHLGVNLGILTLSDTRVRIPFKFRCGKTSTTNGQTRNKHNTKAKGPRCSTCKCEVSKTNQKPIAPKTLKARKANSSKKTASLPY